MIVKITQTIFFKRRFQIKEIHTLIRIRQTPIHKYNQSGHWWFDSILMKQFMDETCTKSLKIEIQCGAT